MLFRSMVNTQFADILAKGDTVNYMDDFLVATKDKATHRERVNELLGRLVTIGLHHLRRYVGLPRFLFLTPLHRSPCTIRSDDFLVAYAVRYDLAGSFGLLCTISISEPLILRYLVLGEFRSLST